MSIGLSLPMVGPANGLSGSQTTRSDGHLPTPDKVTQQQPTFEIMKPTGGPIGGSEIGAPVTQAATLRAENRSNQSNTSQQFGLAAVALETILKGSRGGSETSGLVALDTKKSEQIAQMGLKAMLPQKPSFMNGAESVKAKEIELNGLKALEPQEPSFKKGLDSVRSMNNPSGNAGESRLV